MVDLKEAIAHAMKIANSSDVCSDCAKEHEQLVDFLEELQQYRNTGLKPEQCQQLASEIVYGVGFERLVTLAKADRNGCGFVIPCKTQTKVWLRVGCKIVSGVVQSFSKSSHDPVYAHILFKERDNTPVIASRRVDDLGKTFFFSEDEARSVLEGCVSDA